MQNLIVKSLVLTTVVGGFGAVLWQAQKGLLTSNPKSSIEQFEPLKGPEEKVAQNAPPEKPQTDLLLPSSFPNLELQEPKVPEPTPVKPIEQPPVFEQKVELLQPRPEVDTLASGRQRPGESAGGFQKFFSASGQENHLTQGPETKPEIVPTLAKNEAGETPADPFATREESATSSNPRLAGPVMPLQPENAQPRVGLDPLAAAASADDPFVNPPARLPEKLPGAHPLLTQNDPVLPAASPLLPTEQRNPPAAEVREEPKTAGPWGEIPARVEPRPAESAPQLFPARGLFDSPEPRQAAAPQQRPEEKPAGGPVLPANRLGDAPAADPFANLAGGVEEPKPGPAVLPVPRDSRPLTPPMGNNPLPNTANLNGSDPFGGNIPTLNPQPAAEIPLPPVNPAVPAQADLSDVLPQFGLANSPQPRPAEVRSAPEPVVPLNLPTPIEPTPAPIIRPGNVRSAANNSPNLERLPEPAAPLNSLPQILPAGSDTLPQIQPRQNLASSADLPVPTGPQSPELKIEKIAPPQAVVGEPVVYSIVVRNVGGSTARDVVVEDRVPRGSDLDGTIPQAYMKEPGRLNWTLGTLAPGEQREIKLRVIPKQAGQIGSVATVSFAAAVSASIRVTAPDVKISMQGPSEAVVGEKVTYTITLRNQGEGMAKDVWLRAKLPEGLRHPEGTDVELQVGSLAPGASHPVQLVVVADKLGIVSPQATASNDGKHCGEAVSDLRIIRNRLEISRQGAEGTFVGRSGNTVTRIKNESLEPLRNVTITEQVPPELELQRMSQGGRWNERTRQLTWTIPILKPGESQDLQLETLGQTAGVFDGLVIAQDGAGNRAELKTASHVLGFADLAVDVAAQQRMVTVGDQVSLRLTLKNDGTAAARNVTTRFSIPKGLSFANARGPVTYRQEGQTVIFDPLVEVPVKGEQSFDVVLTAASEGQATVTVEMQSADDATPLRRDQKIRVLSR